MGRKHFDDTGTERADRLEEFGEHAEVEGYFERDEPDEEAEEELRRQDDADQRDRQRP
jgi:hypothetical protein